MVDTQKVEQEIWQALGRIVDPEMNVDIVSLGLVYEIVVLPLGLVVIRMTLTAPSCPVAEGLPEQVRQAAQEATGLEGVDVELVWDPPWTKDRMSPEARWRLDFL